jgi:MFS family permease
MTTTNEGTQSPPLAGSGRLTTTQRTLLAIVLIADVLDLMDSTITNIAAPTIARDIGGGESLIKWLGASYALAMGVVGGRLGDRYGKRRMFLVGMAGFTLASVWCGLSVDPAMLIAGRLVQGGFGALLIPQGIGILLGALSREQLPRAFGVFGPVMGASAILGPIVAGFIISANLAGLTWRPIFLINIVLGTAGFAAAAAPGRPGQCRPHRRAGFGPPGRQHAQPDLRAD